MPDPINPEIRFGAPEPTGAAGVDMAIDPRGATTITVWLETSDSVMDPADHLGELVLVAQGERHLAGVAAYPLGEQPLLADDFHIGRSAAGRPLVGMSVQCLLPQVLGLGKAPGRWVVHAGCGVHRSRAVIWQGS